MVEGDAGERRFTAELPEQTGRFGLESLHAEPLVRETLRCDPLWRVGAPEVERGGVDGGLLEERRERGASPLRDQPDARADESSPADGTLPRSSQSTSWAWLGFSANPFGR